MKAILEKTNASLSDSNNELVSESEIEHIYELHNGIKRAARKMLKDAVEIGEFFERKHKEYCLPGNRKSHWQKWAGDYFPKIALSTIYRYMSFAKNQEFLKTIPIDPDSLTLAEADRMIRSSKRQPKARVRAV